MQEELILLSRARSLDQEALAEIHNIYYDGIYRYISFRINDVQTVEDLTSEVFVRFLSALRERSAPQKTLKGWLFGAASLIVKEQYRKQARAKFTYLDESIPSQESAPEQDVNSKMIKENLRAALGELTQAQQDVLALRFGGGMPIREVAKTVNKSEGSVKMLQKRAISALNRILTGGEQVK